VQSVCSAAQSGLKAFAQMVDAPLPVVEACVLH
jgi:hypothetical protein